MSLATSGATHSAPEVRQALGVLSSHPGVTQAGGDLTFQGTLHTHLTGYYSLTLFCGSLGDCGLPVVSVPERWRHSASWEELLTACLGKLLMTLSPSSLPPVDTRGQ